MFKEFKKKIIANFYIIFFKKCLFINMLFLGIHNFKQVLLTLVPEEPTIPSNICEELIILALSIYRLNDKDELKAQCLLYWLLCK